MDEYINRKIYYTLKKMFNNFTVNDVYLHLNDNNITKEKIENFLDTLTINNGALGKRVGNPNRYFFKRFTE